MVWRATWGLVQMLRPVNGALAALAAFIGMLAVPGGLPLPRDLWRVPLVVFLVTAFGNVLNDLADEMLDRKAHPTRPLPSHRVRRGHAQVLAGLLVASAMAVAVGLGVWLQTFVAACVLVLLLYEADLKRRGLVGNLAVAALSASAFAFGALAVAMPAQWGPLWVLVTMALFASLAREIAKDIEDHDADMGFRRTLPHRLGRRPAGLVAFMVAVVAVLTNLAWLATAHAWFTAYGILAGADAVILAAAALAANQPTSARAGIKLGMALALVPYLLDGWGTRFSR